MTPSDVIQIVLMGLLVVVTGIYAWRTFAISNAAKEQADSSVKMAEASQAALRPIINIHHANLASNDKQILVLYKNLGPGPALKLEFYLTHEKRDFQDIKQVSVAEVGEERMVSLSVNSLDRKDWETLTINCDYESVYGEVERFRSSLVFMTKGKSQLQVTRISRKRNNQ